MAFPLQFENFQLCESCRQDTNYRPIIIGLFLSHMIVNELPLGFPVVSAYTELSVAGGENLDFELTIRTPAGGIVSRQQCKVTPGGRSILIANFTGGVLFQEEGIYTVWAKMTSGDHKGKEKEVKRFSVNLVPDLNPEVGIFKSAEFKERFQAFIQGYIKEKKGTSS